MHLAQLNIGILHHPMDHPKTAEFAENLDHINALAEKSPGFIWRMQGENGNNTDTPVSSNPLEIINISVWEDVASLQHFAYKTEHVSFVRRRSEWFAPYPGPHMVLWWIPEGHRPSLEESLKKLRLITEKGESEEAFTFRKIFQK